MMKSVFVLFAVVLMYGMACIFTFTPEQPKHFPVAAPWNRAETVYFEVKVPLLCPPLLRRMEWLLIEMWKVILKYEETCISDGCGELWIHKYFTFECVGNCHQGGGNIVVTPVDRDEKENAAFVVPPPNPELGQKCRGYLMNLEDLFMEYEEVSIKYEELCIDTKDDVSTAFLVTLMCSDCGGEDLQVTVEGVEPVPLQNLLSRRGFHDLAIEIEITMKE